MGFLLAVRTVSKISCVGTVECGIIPKSAHDANIRSPAALQEQFPGSGETLFGHKFSNGDSRCFFKTAAQVRPADIKTVCQLLKRQRQVIIVAEQADDTAFQTFCSLAVLLYS